MQISSVKKYHINYNSRQAHTKEHSKAENNSYCENNSLPSGFYLPFCANNKKKPVKSTLTQAQQRQLVKLRHIVYFENAAKGTPKEDIRKIAELSDKYQNILTEILAGNYIAVFDNSSTSRPIIDLKEIGNYNFEHPDNPKNLYTEIMQNELALSTMNVIKSENMQPYDFDTLTINTNIRDDKSLSHIQQRQFDTKIQYRNREMYDEVFKRDKEVLKLSQKQIEKLYRLETPKIINNILQNNDYSPELRKKLLSLLDIPFFTASIANLKENDIAYLVKYIIEQEPLMSLILKRGAYVVDRKNNLKRPLFDLENFAKYNFVNSNAPKNLLEEITTNTFLQAVIDETEAGHYKPFAFILKNFHERSFSPCFLEEGDNLNECLFDLNEEYNKDDFPYFVVFNKDLNNIEKSNKMPDIKPSPENHTIMPKNIFLLLKSDKITTNGKKALYELGEIPYFYANLENASDEEIEGLIDLYQMYGEDFEMLLKGEITIDSEKYSIINGCERKEMPIIDLKAQLIKNKKNPNASSKLLKQIKYNTLGETMLEQVFKYNIEVGSRISYIVYTLRDKGKIDVQICYYKGKNQALKSKALSNKDLPIEILEELNETKSGTFIVYLEPNNF